MNCSPTSPERHRYWAELPLTVKFDGVNIQARVDLLFFRSFGEPTIVEWKTYDGIADGDAHLQTALYAWLLCRHERWRVNNPAAVERIEVQLLRGEVHRHRPVEDDFAELEDRLYQNIDEIRSLCGTTATTNSTCPSSPSPRTRTACRFCVFRPLCAEGPR